MPLRGFNQKELDRYLCRSGDILVVKSSGSAANVISGKAGFVHPSTAPFVFSNFLLRITAKSEHLLPRFLYFLLLSDLTRQRVLRMVSTTTYPNLRVSEYSSELLPIPPAEEQAAIVRYLNWACGRLDRAIRAKRKVIALLNEQKQAIISVAVTRGVDPRVPLKHSGVDWMPEIPAGWSVFRIKNVMRAVDHRSASGTEDLLSVRMHHGIVRFSEHFQRPPQARTLVNFKIVEPGQFVVNRMQAGNGLIFCSDLFGLVSPDYSVLDVVADVNKEFLGELMRSRLMRWKFRVESKGLGTGTSGFLRLYDDRLGAVHVALPPRHEQDSIMLELKGKLSGLVDATGRVQREMDLLLEYRTRLIADVVTGKLNVTEVAARLPAEDIQVDEGFSSDTGILDDEELEPVE